MTYKQFKALYTSKIKGTKTAPQLAYRLSVTYILGISFEELKQVEANQKMTKNIQDLLTPSVIKALKNIRNTYDIQRKFLCGVGSKS